MTRSTLVVSSALFIDTEPTGAEGVSAREADSLEGFMNGPLRKIKANVTKVVKKTTAKGNLRSGDRRDMNFFIIKSLNQTFCYRPYI